MKNVGTLGTWGQSRNIKASKGIFLSPYPERFGDMGMLVWGQIIIWGI